MPQYTAIYSINKGAILYTAEGGIIVNLKDAFRYQNVLERLANGAEAAICLTSNTMKVTKTHLRSKVSSDFKDETELIDEADALDPNLVIKFMARVIEEREKLTTAIGEAKRNLHGSIGDLDAAVEANKYRQNAAKRIKAMLGVKASKKIERGTGYTFNAEGTQVPYVYDVEVVSEEQFDRAMAKRMVQKLLAKADEVSAAIDDAVINTMVNYKAPWPVNDSFEDILAAFKEEVGEE